MKKYLMILFFINTFTLFAQPGMLQTFIQQQEAQIVQPQNTFLKGAAILGTACLTAQEYARQQQIAHSRSGIASTLLWASLGAATVLLLMYKFIGHEMGIIIETKSTLKKLTEQVSEWEKVLPSLQQNQHDLSEKLKTAMTVLDTIVPLVSKISAQASTPINPDFVLSMKQELDDLKDLIHQIGLTQLHSVTDSLQNEDTMQKQFDELAKKSELMFAKM